MKVLVELGEPTYSEFSKEIKKQAHRRPDNVFDFTMLNTFMECPAKFYQRHEEHLVSVDFAPAALTLGGGIHNALALYYNTLRSQGNKCDLEELTEQMKQAFVAHAADVIKAKKFPIEQKDAHDGKRCVFRAFDILEAYVEHYGYDMFEEILEVESPFAIIIPYLDKLSGEEGEIIYVGRRDALVVWNGQVYVLEHKTSSLITQFYLESYALDYQVSGYIKSVRELTGLDNRKAIINVLGVYKSSTKYERSYEHRSDIQLDYFTGQIVQITKTILEMRQRVREGEDPRLVFWRCPKACFKWNSRCSFHGLCTAQSPSLRDALISSRFDRSLWSPYDIHEADELDED